MKILDLLLRYTYLKKVKKVEVGKALKVSQQQASMIFSGKRKIHFDDLLGLIAYFNLNDHEALEFAEACFDELVPEDVRFMQSFIINLREKINLPISKNEMLRFQSGARFQPFLNDEVAVEIMSDKSVLALLEKLAEMPTDTRKKKIQGILGMLD